MPVIRVPDPVFERLQAIATPLVDTPASVIEKLLDFYETRQRQIRPNPTPLTQSRETTVNSTEFDPDTPPDLRHTRVLAAELNGQGASNWNELVYLAHRQAIARLKSFDALRSATRSNIASGRRSDRGFHYLSDVNISIQNVDANLAWRNILHLARQLKVAVRVQFEWRESEGAVHPGRRGSLAWAPVSVEHVVRAEA